MFTENLFEETLNLYRDSRSKSITLDCIRSFLSNEAFEKSFVAHINKLLSASSTRLDGLQLVTECIEEISPDVLFEQGSFWVKCCLTNYEHSLNKEIHLKAIRSVVECAQKHSEFSRKLVAEFLTTILDISLNDETDLCVKKSSLECIISCLKYFSSFCKQHRRKIEDYLLRFLESPSEKLVADSGVAFIHCQKVPSCGNSTISCINNLTICLRKLCVTCHQCLDQIFEQWLEIERFEVEDIEPFNISGPPPHYNSYLKVQYRTQIIVNVLQWVISFFSEGAAFELYPEIFSLLERGLSIHKCTKQDSIETKYFSFNLMQIQTKILQVLNTLIISLKTSIAPFYPLISEIVRDLNKNKNCDCYLSCSLFQEYLYEILLNLSVIGHGLEKPLQNILVSQIIKNNTPIEDGVTVKIHANMVGKSSKTKQNMILKSMNSKNNGMEKPSLWTKAKLEASISSLKGLLILIRNNSLNDEALDKITCFLIENILLLQKGNIKPPFDNRQSQELLYEILCLVFEHERPNICWKYGQQINKILVTGCVSENLNISSLCGASLRSMEKIFHALISASSVCTNEYSESSRNFSAENGQILTETKFSTDTILQENEIRILENNVLVPAKIENQTDDQEVETQVTQKKDEVIENRDQANTELKETENESMNLEDNNILNEQICSKEKEIDRDQNLQMEPVLKKRKVEESVANLFANEFNEDYN